MALLYDRKCVVIVGPPESALRIEDLRVRFKVHKDSSVKPNTAEMQITNLSKASRSLVQNRNDPLILQVGYPTTIATLFSGRIRTSNSVREGSDWTTIIRSGDGENAYGYAQISQSFKKGTPLSVVMTALANALANFQTDPIDVTGALQVISGVSGALRGVLPCHGKVFEYLQPLLRQAGFECSIQGGRLEVLQVGQASTESALELGPDTGLIGSPDHGASDGKFPQLNAGVIKLKCLLDPQLRPYKKFNLVSESIKGVFYCLDVDYVGDSSGSANWFNEIQAKPALGSVVA